MTEIAASHDLRPGERVGEYEIVGVLGRGGFAAVYEGVQPIIGKRVAIKVLDARHASGDGVARFVAEARAVNQIAHDNIVDVFSFGELPDGRHFFVMDLLRGTTLDRLIRERGHLPFAEALPILRGIALGLDAAHARRIVHRDLKPENVFVAVDDHGALTPKVLDFGLAKHLVATREGPETQSGALMGTPAYMSPEQARGRSVDHRADIYSFGVVAYEMLTGRVPFTGEDHLAVLVKHTTDEPPPPSSVASDVDPRIDGAILALLEKDPDARPKTLTDAVQALEIASTQSPQASVRPMARALVESVGSGSTFPVPLPEKGAPPRQIALVAAAAAIAAISGAWWVSRAAAYVPEPFAAARAAGVLRGEPASPVASVPVAPAPVSALPIAVRSAPSSEAPPLAVSPSATPSARPPKHAESRRPQLDDVEDPFK